MTLHRVNSQHTQSVSTHNWAGRPRDRVANIEQQRCLFAALLLCGLLVAIGRSQYIEDSVDVGGGAVGSMVYNSRADVVYGGCQAAGVLFAVSCDSNKVVRSLALDWPRYLAYDSVENKGYVAFGHDSLAVIDGSTHQIVKRLPMPGATMPVWDQASGRVYVSCQTTNLVAVVDCTTDSLLTYILVGACPIKMYINTLRRKLYVLNYDDGTVSIVNMATNQVTKTVATESGNTGYYCSCADKFYCDGPRDQCVVIGGQSDTIVARIALPGLGSVLSAAGNEDAGLVYLGTYTGSADHVATVSVQVDSVVAAVIIGREPWGIACFEPSGLVYCASARTDEVRVLTGDGAGILTTLPVGDAPYVFAAVPRHNRLYLGHLNTRYVYVLRDTSAGIAEPQSPRLEISGALSVSSNPFRGAVRVQVRTEPNSARMPTEVEVCATTGRVVRRLQLGQRVNGASCAVWDGRDFAQVPVPAGVYLVTTNSGDCLKVVKAQ